MIDTNTEISTPVSGDSEGEAEDKPTVQIMFTVPKELKALIDARANEEDRSTSALIRELVADEFDFTLPVLTRQRMRKYASEDERKAAQAAKQKERNALVAKLLKAYKAGALGDLELDDDEDDED